MSNIESDDLDARIDRYVRRKMSIEEELEFEATYLDKPEILAKIEEVQLLRGLLKETQKNSKNPSYGLRERWEKILHYMAVPQTGWGALAATLLIVPLLLVTNTSQREGPIGTTSVYLLKSITVRSDENTEKKEFSLTLEKDKKNIVLGFVVMPNLGEPFIWTLEILDEHNQSVWREEKLRPDVESVIYVSIKMYFLPENRYTYHLRSDGNTMVEGTILIKRE
ncbi:MAG: hypothetical protein V4732_21960 [Pseudomonadota bacterium]